MNKMLRAIPVFLMALLFMPSFTACSDDETYAELRKKENQQIEGFLKTGVQIMDDDAGDYVLNVPGNIKVISENEFYAQDSTTNVEKNEYVLFKNSGVYMQIVRKGVGTKLQNNETSNILLRYTEFDIARDSVKTTNLGTSTSMINPDVMTCSNYYGTFSASFLSGIMYSYYQSSSVPAGWLIPLTYIHLGRQNGPNEEIAKVRLIVPSGQGHSDASTNVYACFYEITYQRGRM